jgi:hypothetical protein
MNPLENPVIDFPIERINRFLKNHTFEVPLHYDVFQNVTLPIKIKLTGMKNLISVGERKPYIVYEFYIVPGTETQDFLSSIYFGEPNQTEIPSPINTTNHNVSSVLGNMNELLRNFLRYWGVNYGVTFKEGFTYVPYNIDIKGINLG